MTSRENLGGASVRNMIPPSLHRAPQYSLEDTIGIQIPIPSVPRVGITKALYRFL